jgi:hypothetical protein
MWGRIQLCCGKALALGVKQISFGNDRKKGKSNSDNSGKSKKQVLRCAQDDNELNPQR